ncbi:MAG: hypothetical protein IKJ01_07140 [Lachnospiraceae bacterium]|nr:hypothetical protein [Lachnospiraceae bacterium]
MEEKCYIGIDLNDHYAMISYYQLNKKEPETIALGVGGTMYQIPTLLAKKKTLAQWYYGDDARKKAKTSEVICVDALLPRALHREQIYIEGETYEAIDLLAVFLKKVMELPKMLGNVDSCNCLVLTVEHLSQENMEVLQEVFAKIGLTQEQFMLIDYKESFYYFTISQPQQLWIRNVYLFEYDGESLQYYALDRNTRTMPQVVTIKESHFFTLQEPKDESFFQILQKAFDNQVISSVFLVGEGFEGGWMQKSLSFLCRGRRAFVGNNLFSKGACYAAYMKESPIKRKVIYMGDNEMRFNLCLKMKNRGKVDFFTLINAGKNRFEEKGECEMILSGTPEIDFWKQLPSSREAIIEKVTLTDFPKRPDRTTRLHILATPIANDKIEVEIRDLGFGEIFKSTNKVWKYIITV